MEITHNTCTGVPDIKSPQCYQCRDLSVCTLLFNNLKAIQQMFIQTQQAIRVTCQDIFLKLTTLIENQKKYEEETLLLMTNICNGTAALQEEMDKQKEIFKDNEVSLKSEESLIKKELPEVVEYPESEELPKITEAEIKNSVFEKGKQMLGLIKS